MEKLSSTGVQLEFKFMPSSIKPPGATKHFILAGAGERFLELNGTAVKITATGFYLEEKAFESLAIKWKGKTDVELLDSDEFYSDIYNGPFERLMYINVLIPLPGKLFSESTSQRLVRKWKHDGTFTDLDGIAVDKYLEVFKDEMLDGRSILITIAPEGSVTLNMGKDGIITETPIAVLECNKWGPTMMGNAIGRDGFYQEARRTIASRLSDLFNQVE